MQIYPIHQAYSTAHIPRAAVTSIWKCDYNRNGTVDSADTLAMRKLMANVMIPTGDQPVFFCVLFDVNKIDVVDSADILDARKQMANVDPMY